MSNRKKNKLIQNDKEKTRKKNRSAVNSEKEGKKILNENAQKGK